MPMDFPTFDSLKFRAKQRKFREPGAGETEAEYRFAFSEFMRKIDSVEASEILSGNGWDKQGSSLLMHFMGSDRCKDCGRKAARSFDEVGLGMCPKSYAVRDPEAKDDCKEFQEAPWSLLPRGYYQRYQKPSGPF